MLRIFKISYRKWLSTVCYDGSRQHEKCCKIPKRQVIPIRNVLQYLEQAVCLSPAQTACVDESHSYTYQELYHRSRSVGSALSRRIRPREPVAVYLEKGCGALSAFFGTVYAGGFYSYFNPELPSVRLQQIQSVLQARYVITDQFHLPAIQEVFPPESILLLDELLEPVDPQRLAAIRAAMIDTDPLYVNFTSGSTGLPKGVLVSHRSVLDFIDVFTPTFSLTQTDRIGNQAPFDFDVSVKDIYGALKLRATLVVIPRRLFSRPKELLDFLCDQQVTTLIWAVSALCLISTFHGLDYRTPETVRNVLFSGEVMPLKHLKTWMDHLPQAQFVNLYGPTEITCNCTYHILDRERDYQAGIPIGRPFPNEEVFLLDEENREIRHPEVIGELCVRGTALALGYYRAPRQTASAFVPDPRNPVYPEFIYRTGDLARYTSQGELMYCGRKDFQIKHLGHRVELEEIERAVSALPGVDRCCCVYEEERQKIHAFYVGDVEAAQLRRQIKEKLPYFMVPGTLTLVERFPLTKNGKVDRKQLLKGGASHV